MSVFIQNNVAASSEVVMGGQNGAYAYIQPYTSGNFVYDLNAGAFPSVATPRGGTKGAWVVSRTSATAENAYANGSSTSFSLSSTAVSAVVSLTIPILAFY